MSRPIFMRSERSGTRRRSRRQRLDIDGDRLAVALRQHRRIGDDIGHRRADAAMVGRIPGLQHLGDLLLRPVADARRRDIRIEAGAFRILPPGITGLWT